jgi:hypothetical protein
MKHRFRGRTRAFTVLIAGACALLYATISIAFDEQDLFLLDIQADGYLLAESVPAYRSGDDYLIEFPAFLEAVEFPITYEDSVWSGWFRSESTQFSWNTENEIAYVTGREGAQIDILQWVEESDGFYVSTDMLGVWFDLELDVDPRQQIVTIVTENPLPFQEWQQRSLAKYNFRSARSLDADIIVPDEYQWATLPQFNLATHAVMQRQDGMKSHAVTGSMVVGLDLLKHSVLYTGVSTRSEHNGDTNVDSTHRLTIERGAATPEGTLFAGANRYMVGDIFQGVTNLVVSSNNGSGFSIGRFSEGDTGSLSTISIVGDAPPGWEVELYRNDTLIDFGSVGTDGRYVFPDQEVPFGENIFVAKVYGPQGQTRENRQVFWGGGTELAEGDYDYSVSHINYDQYFLGGELENADSLPASYATDFRFSRAWTENFQIGAAYTRAGLGTRDRDGTYTDNDYFSLLGRAKLGPGVIVGETATQLDAGVAWSLEYLTGRNGHNVSVAHRVFSDYESPATIHQDELGTVNEISVFGPMGKNRASGYTVRVRHRDKTDGTKDIRIFNRLGTRLGPVSLSNDFEHIDGDGQDTNTGSLKAAGRIKGLSLRGQLDYDFSGGDTFRQISTTLNWDYNARLNNNLILVQKLTSDRDLYFTNLLSYRVKKSNLTFSVSSDADDMWQVGGGFNIAFGYDKRRQSFVADERDLANTGRAAMNLFIDENNNGVREPDEPPIEWAAYQGEEIPSSSPGTLSLNGLPRYRPVKIETRHFKFDDPFLVPRAQIYELYTHAGGDISVDIAVVMTGDVEGNIYSGSADEPQPVKGVIVTLFDERGRQVAAVRSEFDGFYSFNGIPAGHYEVRVTPKTGEALLTQLFELDGKDGYVVLDEIYLYE